MDKLNIAKEWFKFADSDLATAEYLLNMRPIPLEIICYHAQQSAEKFLKGFLIQNDCEAPKTHDLKELCRRCAEVEEAFDTISTECAILNPFAVQPRYPFELEIEEEDAKQALVNAKRIKDFVKKINQI